MRLGDLFFRHLRSPPGYDVGTVTAACLVVESRDDYSILRVAFAFCSPWDQFSRAKGRAIAFTRLANETSRTRAVHVKVAHPTDTVALALMRHLSVMYKQGDPLCPHWLETWLDPYPF